MIKRILPGGYSSPGGSTLMAIRVRYTGVAGGAGDVGQYVVGIGKCARGVKMTVSLSNLVFVWEYLKI